MMARLNLSHVYGICLADNTASCRVLEKCGFRRIFEGIDDYQGVPRPIVRMRFDRA